MAIKEKNIKETEEQPAQKLSWRNRVEKISYNSIVKNIPFMLFVALLAVLYIANTSRAVSLTREIAKKNKEIKELRWQWLDIQSSLMKATSESELTKRSAAIGLKPLEKPAYEITIKESLIVTNKNIQ